MKSTARATYLGVGPLELRQGRAHTLHNGDMDLRHVLSHVDGQLEDCTVSPERFGDLLMEPGVDVDSAELQLFHYHAQRRHPACNMLRLVCECFEKPCLVLLAIQARNESLGRCGVNSASL